jgi:hypothetical protein
MSPETIHLRAQIIAEIWLFTEKLQAASSFTELQAIRERMRHLIELLEALKKKTDKNE